MCGRGSRLISNMADLVPCQLDAADVCALVGAAGGQAGGESGEWKGDSGIVLVHPYGGGSCLEGEVSQRIKLIVSTCSTQIEGCLN